MKRLAGMSLPLSAVAVALLVSTAAHAQPTETAQPETAAPTSETAAPAAAESQSATQASGDAPAAGTEEQKAKQPADSAKQGKKKETDHDKIVGRFGLEIRSLGTVNRTDGQCTEAYSAEARKDGNLACPLSLNAISLRRWTSHRYGYGAGLALAAGGGSRRNAADTASESFDTYFGIGPTVSARWVLGNWKHFIISTGPDFDVVFFAQAGSKPQTLMFNLRALVEGEMHLGFLGAPSLTVGTTMGLVGSYRTVKNAKEGPGRISSLWSVGIPGPDAPLSLVNSLFLRLYL